MYSERDLQDAQDTLQVVLSGEHTRKILDNLRSEQSGLNVRLLLARCISEIDQRIESQLNETLHHPKFVALESAWRSLAYLVAESADKPKVQVKVLDITWKEVCRDMDKAADFDQSVLFKIIYEHEYGIAGGTPYSVIISDYQVSHSENDVATLTALSQVAAAAFSPFICNASPALFGSDNYDELYTSKHLENLFELQEYEKWRRLRELSDSRFIGLCLPRVLARKPYTLEQSIKKGLNFTEHCDPAKPDNYCWANASFAFGVTLIREFHRTGWFSHIRGTPRNSSAGGSVYRFPYPQPQSRADANFQVNTEIRITDNKEKELADLGFIALSHAYASQQSAFLSNPSIQQSKHYSDTLANANAHVSAMMQQILCASRFAHYIKVMIRDKVGSFITEQSCQTMLEDWLSQYTSGRQDLDWEMRAKYPLKSYRVTVFENPQKPGSYGSTIQLQPHYHAEHILSELKLTTELIQLSNAM